MLKKILFLIAALFLAQSCQQSGPAAATAAANTYYICPNAAPNGNGSFDAPLRSLTEAQQIIAAHRRDTLSLVLRLCADDGIIHEGALLIARNNTHISNYTHNAPNGDAEKKALVRSVPEQQYESYPSKGYAFNLVAFTDAAAATFGTMYAQQPEPFYLQGYVQSLTNENITFKYYLKGIEKGVASLPLLFAKDADNNQRINVYDTVAIRAVPQFAPGAIIFKDAAHCSLENVELIGNLTTDSTAAARLLTNRNIALNAEYATSGVYISAAASQYPAQTCIIGDCSVTLDSIPYNCVCYYAAHDSLPTTALLQVAYFRRNCTFAATLSDSCLFRIVQDIQLCALKAPKAVQDIRIENVQVRGFGRAGIECYAGSNAPVQIHNFLVKETHNLIAGLKKISIRHCEAAYNGISGIHLSAPFSTQGYDYYHQQYNISDCVTHHNWGVANANGELAGPPTGSGIYVSNVEGCNIARCVAYENGSNNMGGSGGEGIWAFNACRVRITDCESFSNKSHSLDGGGFDFDGGVMHSAMWHNYSHNNEAMGYLINQTDNAPPLHHDTIAYCISLDDACDIATIAGGYYKYHYGAITLWTHGSRQLSDVYILNNVVSSTQKNGYGLKLDVLEAKNQNYRNVVVANNIFQRQAAGALVHADAALLSLPNTTIFESNNYYSGANDSLLWLLSRADAPDSYHDRLISLISWRSKEMNAETRYPQFLNRKLFSAAPTAYTGDTPTPQFSYQLRTALKGYRLLRPWWRRNMMTAAGTPRYTAPKTRDFFGNNINARKPKIDIGVEQK